MKLSKEEIVLMTSIARRALEIGCQYSKSCEAMKDIRDLIDTIEALHTSIATLADSFEAQGRIAEAAEIRGVGE